MGIGLHPKSQIGAVYAHAEATQALPWRREAAPFRTLPQGENTPLVHSPYVRFSARSAPKTCELFPQNLLHISGDFHTFGPFSERVVIFQVEPFMTQKRVIGT